MTQNPVHPLLAEYSPAIDGLRALAIIAVITGHFNESFLPSGYLGVDIFFVISGFVITSSLTNRAERTPGEFLSGFYRRRIKRLVPALALCVFLTSISICLVNPTPGTHLKTGITSLFGLSNIDLFFNSIDYWGNSARFNPFTHTWSLGVEEQFYLLFPVLVWLTVSGRWTLDGGRRLLWCIAIFSAASMAGFSYFSMTNQPASYFLMPFRFWELGAGCMLFLFLRTGRGFAIRKLEKVPPLAIIFTIVAVLFLPLKYTLLATLAVVVLTAILIACLRPMTLGHSVLTRPFVVYIGLISYSLYLWHWSVIALSRWITGIYWWSIPAQLGLILLLAIGSYHFVERPLRYTTWSSSKRRIIGIATISMGGFALLLALLLTPVSNIFYSGTLQSKAEARSLDYSQMIQCGSNQSSIEEQDQKIRVIGNSHSLHILPMLKEITKKCDLKLIAEKHPDYIVIPAGNGEEISKLARVFEPLNENDILILSSRNRFVYSIPYLNVRGDTWIDHSDEKNKYGYGLDLWLLELDRVIELANEKGVHVILFLPNVEFDEPVFGYGSKCKSGRFIKPLKGCNPSVSREFLDSRFPHKFFEEVQIRSEINRNFYVYDPLPVYCDDNKCSRTVNGVIAFRDTNHLTHAGALLMLGDFNTFLIENHLIR